MKYCHFCNKQYATKYSLQRHYEDKKCKGDLVGDLMRINRYLNELKLYKEKFGILTTLDGTQEKEIAYDNIHTIDETNRIELNNIETLKYDYVSPLKFREVVEGFIKNRDLLSVHLNQYLAEILCNVDHPENHVVKYTKMKPPTFLVKNYDGTQLVMGLNETSNALVEPICMILEEKSRECYRHAKRDKNYDFDPNQYVFKDIMKKLKDKESLRKMLKNFFQYTLLNKPFMKVKSTSNNNSISS